MEFNELITAVGFLVLVAVVLGGTWSSPMTQDTKLMVSGGQLVFGVLVLVLGVKHGQYRSSKAGA